MKNACKERVKKVKKCLSKTIYSNQNLIKGIKGCVMNLNDFKKMKFKGLRESRAIKFNDLQEKRRLMNFSGLEKIFSNNL